MKLVREHINFERSDTEKKFRNKLFPKKLKIIKGIPNFFTIEIDAGDGNTSWHTFQYIKDSKYFYNSEGLEWLLKKINVPYTNTLGIGLQIDEKYVEWGEFKGYYENS